MRIRPALVNLETSEWVNLAEQASQGKGLSWPDWYQALLSHHPGSELAFLGARLASGTRVYLPCFVNRGRLGGMAISVADFAEPLGCLTSEEIPLAILGLAKAAASWRMAGFAWVLPPQAALSDKQVEALKRKGIAVEPFLAFVLDLPGNYDELFAGYNVTRRKEIRRGRKAGVHAELCQHWEKARRFFDLYTAAFVDRKWYGRPYPLELLHKVVEGRIRGAELLVAECDQRVVAGVLSVHAGDWVHPVLNAVDRTAGRLYPMTQVIDCAIRRACEGGAVKFNLGGMPSSDAAGLIQWKESWGAKRAEMFQLRYASPLVGVYRRARTLLRLARPRAGTASIEASA